MHVQNTALDSTERKSLFVKVSNWNSERHLVSSRSLLVKKKQNSTQFKATGDRNIVQWSPFETGPCHSSSSFISF